MKRHSKKHSNNLQGPEYLKDIDDWNKNRYNPGFYIGTGRIPPYLKYAKRPISIVLLLSGCAVLFECFLIAKSGFSSGALYPALYGVILVVAGFFAVKGKKNKKSS